jgi:hypothetical protein
LDPAHAPAIATSSSSLRIFFALAPRYDTSDPSGHGAIPKSIFFWHQASGTANDLQTVKNMADKIFQLQRMETLREILEVNVHGLAHPISRKLRLRPRSQPNQSVGDAGA